ncbi:MAG: LytR C-terminal domain-containing protein [Micrococcales bacterium]|nr:LytR C-terminal domain-containing protein [Micrococcales bacterium]
MSKKGYPYDKDEFDAPVDPDGPHGVHRAPRSAWSRWWPFLVVIVVVPALTFAAVYWALQSSPGSSGSSSGQTPAAEQPGEEELPDEDPDDGTEPDDEPADPVLTTQVMVINAGSGQTGLASQVSDALKEAGFATQNTPGNGAKGGRTADTVYYQSEDLRVTAEAVAEAVGEAQGQAAVVEQGLPTVDMPTGEPAPQIIVMLVNKPRP